MNRRQAKIDALMEIAGMAEAHADDLYDKSDDDAKIAVEIRKISLRLYTRANKLEQKSHRSEVRELLSKIEGGA